MNTILQSDGRFGVLMFNPSDSTIAGVGCCAELINHRRLPDDRMKIVTVGQQRFRVLDYVREKPYRVGLVELIEDAPTDQDLQPLADQLGQVLRDVLRLSTRLVGQPAKLPDDIPETPLELSYWVAQNLYGVPEEQQHLLEMQSLEERLEREAEILSSTRNDLAARVALKDAFPKDAFK